MALDWYYPSDDGRLLAYGLSENGSEQSVLQVMDVDTGVLMPERIPHTRAADLAWLPDSHRLLLHPLSVAGRGARGRGALPPRHPLPSAWARTRTDDPLVFKPAEKEHWPGVRISPDGRWLVIGVARTFDQTDLYVMDRLSGARPVAVARDLPASFDGEVAHGRLFMRTNLDAPTYRLYVVDPERPGTGALAGDRAAAGGGGARRRARHGPPPGARLPGAGGFPAPAHRPRGRQRSRAAPAHARQPVRCRCRVGRRGAVLRLLVVHRAAERVPRGSRHRSRGRCGRAWRPTWIPRASRCGRCRSTRRTAPRSPCSWCTAAAW